MTLSRWEHGFESRWGCEKASEGPLPKDRRWPLDFHPIISPSHQAWTAQRVSRRTTPQRHDATTPRHHNATTPRRHDATERHVLSAPGWWGERRSSNAGEATGSSHGGAGGIWHRGPEGGRDKIAASSTLTRPARPGRPSWPGSGPPSIRNSQAFPQVFLLPPHRAITRECLGDVSRGRARSGGEEDESACRERWRWLGHRRLGPRPAGGAAAMAPALAARGECSGHVHRP
jgi:hypothetical protein